MLRQIAEAVVVFVFAHRELLEKTWVGLLCGCGEPVEEGVVRRVGIFKLTQNTKTVGLAIKECLDEIALADLPAPANGEDIKPWMIVNEGRQPPEFLLPSVKSPGCLLHCDVFPCC